MGVGVGSLPRGLPAFGASRGLPASVRQQAGGVVPVVPGGMPLQQAPLPPAIVLSAAGAGTADRGERAAPKAQQAKAA